MLFIAIGQKANDHKTMLLIPKKNMNEMFVWIYGFVLVVLDWKRERIYSNGSSGMPLQISFKIHVSIKLFSLPISCVAELTNKFHFFFTSSHLKIFILVWFSFYFIFIFFLLFRCFLSRRHENRLFRNYFLDFYIFKFIMA